MVRPLLFRALALGRGAGGEEPRGEEAGSNSPSACIHIPPIHPYHPHSGGKLTLSAAGGISLDAADISFTTPGGTVSMADLLKLVSLLPRNSDGGSSGGGTEDEPETLVTDRMLERTVGGLRSEMRSETQGVFNTKTNAGKATQRLDTLEGKISTIQNIGETVAELALDMRVIGREVANITACHEDGAQLHKGDGKCVSPIPSCPDLSPPKDGSMLTPHPQHEFIPGMGVVSECDQGHYASGGNTTRRCLRDGGWNGKDLKCSKCSVQNCVSCDAVDTCTQCSGGQIFDGKETGRCVDYQSIYVFAGSSSAGGLTIETMDQRGTWKLSGLPDLPAAEFRGVKKVRAADPNMAAIGDKIYYIEGINQGMALWMLKSGATKWDRLSGFIGEYHLSLQVPSPPYGISFCLFTATHTHTHSRCPLS